MLRMQAVKPARRCASVRACGPVTAVIVPEPRLHAALEKHPEVSGLCYTSQLRAVACSYCSSIPSVALS